MSPKGINELIKAHAIEDEEWRHQPAVKEAYLIYDRLNKGLFAGKLPQPVIGFNDMAESQKANVPRDVVYHYEGDDISLYHHIDIRTDIKGTRLVLAVLKGMIHQAQENYGQKQTWYYSAEFRKMAATFGVQLDEAGDWVKFTPKWATTEALAFGMTAPATESVKLLLKDATTDYLGMIDLPEAITKAVESLETEWGHEVIPNLVEHPTENVLKSIHKPLMGTSKMVKWQCTPGCTIIRCATELNGMCLECGAKFTKA